MLSPRSPRLSCTTRLSEAWYFFVAGGIHRFLHWLVNWRFLPWLTSHRQYRSFDRCRNQEPIVHWNEGTKLLLVGFIGSRPGDLLVSGALFRTTHGRTNMAKEPKNLDDLFHDTLKDIYFAEKKILATLPKM